MGQCRSQDRINSKLLFGTQLETLFDIYKSVFPPILRAIDFLEQRSTIEEASFFFRPAIPQDLVRLLLLFEEKIYERETYSLNGFSSETVGCFLKEFFSRLPDPLLTFARYDQLVKAMNQLQDVSALCDENPDFYDRLFFVQAVIVTLPKSHFLTLERVIRFFNFLSKRTPADDQIAVKLGAVFADSFLRSKKKRLSDFKSDKKITTAEEQQCLVFLINNYEHIFRHNPVRSSNILFQQDELNRAELKERHHQVHKLSRQKLVMKNRVAGIQFRSKIVVRHFLAWHRLTQSGQKNQKRFARLQQLQLELIQEKSESESLRDQLSTVIQNHQIKQLQDVLENMPKSGPSSFTSGLNEVTTTPSQHKSGFFHSPQTISRRLSPITPSAFSERGSFRTPWHTQERLGRTAPLELTQTPQSI